MKKKFLLIASVACMFCLSLALLAGCGGSSNNNGAPDYLGKDGKFVVGFDQDFEPFAIVNSDGSFSGFDIELAQAVAEKNGWEIELTPIAWDTKDAEIDSGTIDVIWNGFTMTDERKNSYAFTKPYYLNEQVILVPEGSSIQSLADLAGKTVVAQGSSAAYEALEEGGDYYDDLGSTFKQLTSSPEYNSAMMLLQSGAADAMAVDYPKAQDLLSKYPGYVVLDEIIYTEEFGVGAKKGNTKLTDQIQKTLIELYNDGTVEEIASHYPGKISYDKWLLVE